MTGRCRSTRWLKPESLKGARASPVHQQTFADDSGWRWRRRRLQVRKCMNLKINEYSEAENLLLPHSLPHGSLQLDVVFEAV